MTYGKSPIPLTFQIPKAIVAICSPMYANLTGHSLVWVLSLSNLANVEPTVESALSGFINSIAVIMILKICRELPDMYIMIAFMGMVFAGAMAISQAFLRKRSSVSTGVGAGCSLLPDF